MSEPPLAASVVVPTRNRRHRLEALLRSLAEQNGERFETVVADDASTDDTPELLRRGVPGLRLKVVRHEKSRGRAGARNAALPLTSGALVVFTDDDVVPEAGWLSALLEAHRRRPGAILQGHTTPDPDELARSTVFWRSIRVEGPDDLAPTCNIAYPRELLARVGGFDERKLKRMGEDTDLAWRTRKAGAEFVFVDGARARHAVHQQGLIGALRDSHRMMDMAALVRRHPEVRHALHRRVFLEPSHERALLLVAGIALWRRSRGASLLLGLPHAAAYRPHHPSWIRTLAALPAYALVDLLRVVLLGAAGARQRTFLL